VRGQLHGPFTKLPDPVVRRLALDVVATLILLVDENLDDGLEAAVGRAVADTEEASYWAAIART